MNEIELRKSFGKRLCFIRKSKKLTQERLSELIELDPQYYCKMENGNHFPSVKTLAKITQVYNMAPNELFDFDSKKSTIADEVHILISNLSDRELKVIKNLILSLEELR